MYIVKYQLYIIQMTIFYLCVTQALCIPKSYSPNLINSRSLQNNLFRTIKTNGLSVIIIDSLIPTQLIYPIMNFQE